jgi:hypothetical protein
MLEFDVDMRLVADELDLVVLHDECGETEPVEYVPKPEAERLRRMISWLIETVKVGEGMAECGLLSYHIKDELHSLGFEVE